MTLDNPEFLFWSCSLSVWSEKLKYRCQLESVSIILQDTKRKCKPCWSFLHHTSSLLPWTHYWGHHPRSSVVNSYLWTGFLIAVNVNKAPAFKRRLPSSQFNGHTWLPSRQNTGDSGNTALLDWYQSGGYSASDASRAAAAAGNADTTSKVANGLKLRLRLLGQVGRPTEPASSSSAPDSI